MQLPGADNRPEGLERKADDVHIGEYFMEYEKIESALTGKWTNFRGESLDNIVKTADPVKVPAEDYPVLWQVETGEGHAARPGDLQRAGLFPGLYREHELRRLALLLA